VIDLVYILKFSSSFHVIDPLTIVPIVDVVVMVAVEILVQAIDADNGGQCWKLVAYESLRSGHQRSNGTMEILTSML